MSLLFPLYLLGLTGLALPWLLHRFSDQQPEERSFPSKRFLEETTPPVSRKRRLKHLTLLALRVMSLLLLCFLFAQPWLSRIGNAGPALTHHIIALDQSLSMRAEGRWQRAVSNAQSLIDDLPQADSIELIGFDSVVTRIADDKETQSALSKGLSAMQPGFLAADYGRTMQALNARAAEQEIPVKLWLISDQQQSSLPAQLNALYAPQVEQFEWISVLDESQFNVHLAASAQSSDSVNVRLSAQLSASVSNAGQGESENDVAERQVSVQVLFNAELLAEQRVVIAAGSLESVVFDQLILPPGKNPVLQVRLLEDDALNEDNAVSLVVEQADPTPIAYLQNDRDVSGNAPVFVSTAFETDSAARVDLLSSTAERVPPETPHVVTGRDLGADNIALDVLQFVDQGNNALVFDSRTSLAPVATVRGAREVGLVDDTHPLALGDIDWLGTRFYEVAPLALKTDDRVLIETTDREPVLIERTVARGRLLILNDRLDGQASNLPLQPAFVSLMQSLLEYFDASTTLPKTVTVGERLALPSNIQVLDPDDEPLLALDASGRSSALLLEKPGLYSVIGNRGEHALSVVLDVHEANLSTLDNQAISAWQARYDPSTNDSAGNSAKKPLSVDAMLLAQGNDSTRMSLWQWLLPVVFIVIMSEGWLGNRRLDVRRDGS